jgi:hypothetical protein
MKRIYKTAQGKQIDIDSLQIANEQTIAVGNMKVNARGDELGPGGKVSAGRNQSMESYYKLHTPSAGTSKLNLPQENPSNAERIRRMQQEAGIKTTQGVTVSRAAVADDNITTSEPITEQAVIEEPAEVSAPAMRGSLADSIAKQTTVTQELVKPVNQKTGPQRI